MIVNVETTDAARSDQRMVERIHDQMEEQDLLPDEHFVDTGYLAARVVPAEAHHHGVQLVGPMPPDTGWQAAAKQGFDGASFTIDWQAHTATCPQGVIATQWRQQHDSQGRKMIRSGSPTSVPAVPGSPTVHPPGGEPRDVVIPPRATSTTCSNGRAASSSTNAVEEALRPAAG